MAGAALVVAGVCTAAWPSGDGPSVFSQARFYTRQPHPTWP